MKRTVQITGDGSQTIGVEELNVTYHSTHGAIQESLHVFIDAGLRHISAGLPATITVFEMGFGTGLNALLTFLHAPAGAQVYYYAAENSGLKEDEWQRLSYGGRFGVQDAFEWMHKAKWNTDVLITPSFTLHKSSASLMEAKPEVKFNLVYFDAFAPSAQPELWTEAVFRKMHALLMPGGVLVTYCSKGDVRRAMIAAGFAVEKLSGPPGKREMLRATKRCCDNYDQG